MFGLMFDMINFSTQLFIRIFLSVDKNVHNNFDLNGTVVYYILAGIFYLVSTMVFVSFLNICRDFSHSYEESLRLSVPQQTHRPRNVIYNPIIRQHDRGRRVRPPPSMELCLTFRPPPCVRPVVVRSHSIQVLPIRHRTTTETVPDCPRHYRPETHALLNGLLYLPVDTD